MTIRFLCPTGHHLSVPDEMTGKLVRCARCKETIRVPKPAVSVVEKSSRDDPSESTERPATEKPVRTGRRFLRRGHKASPPEERPPKKRPPKKRNSDRPSRKDGPKRMPPDVYAPDRGHVATVRGLAMILGLVIAFSVCPVFYLAHWNLAAAPGWARIVVLLAVVQAAYIAWMLNVPDWSSVWVAMLVFAAVSTLYGTATAIALATPIDQPMLLGMTEVRHSAGAWCGSVLLVMSLATYLCGRTSAQWRRSFELETAGRGAVSSKAR